jgi:hypothetical protein
MSAQKGSLAKAVEDLRQILNRQTPGREAEWVRRMGDALVKVEQAAAQHRARLKDEQGRVVAVDTPLNPSPTVDRRADELRQELDDLVQEARRLKGKLSSLHPVSAEIDPGTAAGALPVAPETADVADFSVFCERVERLLQGFEHFDEAESDLIQESITLDLGAGD